MPRIFAYVRVSTTDQNPENQIQEIKAAGFAIEPHRIIAETISGCMPIARREGFNRLLDKMEKGDVLIVTKLYHVFFYLLLSKKYLIMVKELQKY